MPFEYPLLERGVVEGRQLGLCPSKAPDQRKLPDNDVGDETELGLPREFESILDLALHLTERGPGSERVRDQIGTAIGRIGQFAGLLRGIERAPHVGTAGQRGCIQGAT